MKEKSTSERVMTVLGMIFRFVTWLGGLVFALVRALWKMIGSERTRQAVSDVKQRAGGLVQGNADSRAQTPEPAPIEPDISSGEDTVVQGLGGRAGDTTHLQHADLGGIPAEPNLDASFADGGPAPSHEGGLSAASAYSSSGTTYDADISREGVELTYTDETDRGEDTPLDEGIPNLGEPRDIEDAGPSTAAAEAVVEEVQDGIPEEYGETQEIDSVSNDEPWVADEPGEADEIPAASRGLREYGEAGTEESEIEDMSDTDEIGLYDDVDPSGAGGEVDLENDESPSWDESELSIVDDPNEPLASDAATPLDDEETLGLRDSESPGVSDDLRLEDESDITSREHLGVTGDFGQADATERIPAAPGEPGSGTEGGDELREQFTTGDEGHTSRDQVGGVDTEDSGDFGRTDEFGAPSDEVMGTNVSDDMADLHEGRSGERRGIIPARETTEPGGDHEHLGISGDFDEADATQTVPAEPVADEASVEDDTSRESFVTGDDANQSGEQKASSGGEGQGDNAGYSAAWSTPAGVVGQAPDQEAGSTGFEDLSAPGGTETSQGSEVGSAATMDSGSDAGESAGESGQITSGAEERATSGSGSFFLDDLAGGDPADLTAAAVGDLGTATIPGTEGQTATSEEAGDAGSTRADEQGPDVTRTTITAGHAREEEPSSRKSRKQRKQQSDWVPQGAVRGDGNPVCPAEFPIKGNANSRIYHRPTDPSYEPTIPEFCFATEEDAQKAGFRAPKG